MLNKLATLAVALSLTAAAAAFADTPSATDAQAVEKSPGPCKQIVDACKSAGFVAGDRKSGSGLYADCIEPMMRGGPQPAKATKPLPSVSADVVAACKQAHPTFGQGKKNPTQSQ